MLGPKSFLALSAAGFLAACAQTAAVSTEGGGSAVAPAVLDAALILDAGLAGRLDAASQSGNAVVYAYYTDVISDTQVLNGADIYCGGPGQAVINLTRGENAGHAYNTMAFTCR